MSKEMLLSITRDDFDIQFFRAGGSGGQKQNKTSSGCRVVHRESGAVGEGRDTASQYVNKTNAFNRCIQSTQFQNWLKIKCGEALVGKTLEQQVTDMMNKENLRIEVRDENGKWKEE